MKLSEEMAVRLHRMMWSDMQKELGNNPSGKERAQFKFDWIHKHFPSESIANDCWLCEYASSVVKPGDHEAYCKYCPISWPFLHCNTWPFLHCNTLDFSYAKAPISEILALPAKNVANDYEHVAYSYYKSREYLLSKASGLPASLAIEEHAKAIQEKAVADEQKAPIFHALAEASGLSAGNVSVKAHISEISSKAKSKGRAEMATEIFETLCAYSGVSKDNWSVGAHVKAIQANASNEKDLNENEIRKKLKDAIDALKLYQSTLSYERRQLI